MVQASGEYWGTEQLKLQQKKIQVLLNGFGCSDWERNFTISTYVWDNGYEMFFFFFSFAKTPLFKTSQTLTPFIYGQLLYVLK